MNIEAGKGDVLSDEVYGSDGSVWASSKKVSQK
jgi:hypothetical protein